MSWPTGRAAREFLLDTHAQLWALTDPPQLGSETHRIIAVRSSRKLPQADALAGGYARHLDRLGAIRLAITEEHALLAGRLEWTHRDPFDRVLAAQAMIESFTLLTNDSALTNLPGLATVW